MKKKVMKKSTPVKQAMDSNDNSNGVVAVTMGLISIISALLTSNLIAGIIFGVIGWIYAVKQTRQSYNSWARLGKILSIVGIVLGFIAIAVSVWVANALGLTI